MNIRLSRLLRSVFFISLMVLSGCAAQKETVYTPPPAIQPPPPQPEVVYRPEPVEPATPAPKEEPCEEDTARKVNGSGIETMPFMRLNFADVDGSGLQDMIVGNKHGYVYLYKNSGNPVSQPWRPIPGYFEGVKAGAFSSPALADLDGDGKAELIIGTGGFSSDSGKMFFFKNAGSAAEPSWKKIDDLYLSIGNDAAVTVVDYALDGRPGIIACNSEGKIFFFRNVGGGGGLKFIRETNPPVKMNFGMYAVPSAKRIGDKVFLAVGNSMGKMFLFEISKDRGVLSSRQIRTGLKAKAFASPAFASLLNKDRVDLVVADGDGVISYYENLKGDFSSLKKSEHLFNNRLLAGPVCTPTVSCVGEKTYMVVGNIDGTLRLFEQGRSANGIPWTERTGYFSGIKVKGFSRGVLTSWEGRNMLVVGQGNGNIRAFVNMGNGNKPVWKEKMRFFQGVGVKEHSTPVIFDPDGNGKWVLISGSGDGGIYAFRIKGMKKGLPEWERVTGPFDSVKVDRFSVPTLVKDEKSVYLFVGQQDGRIRTFTSEIEGKPFDYRKLRFTEKGLLEGIRMNEHSSPFVSLNDGVFDIISGDYNGNLRHFLCKKKLM